VTSCFQVIIITKAARRMALGFNVLPLFFWPTRVPD